MRRPSDLLVEIQPLLVAAAAAVIVALSYIFE